MTGLTIVFISKDRKHSTSINYKKFGDRVWDDCEKNNSKIGYYFAYYYKKDSVFIHKITNITSSDVRPSYMDWVSDRQTLYLSPILKKYTWNEWISCIGLGSPYANNYRYCKTSSWSYKGLKEFKFNFDDFIKDCEV